MSNRIKYSCKNCGWTGSIVAEWADIKPRKCPKKKCKTSFLKNPDKLLMELPQNVTTSLPGPGADSDKPE